MHALRLEQLTIFDAGPEGLVDIASELGVPMVSLWTGVLPWRSTDGFVTRENQKVVRDRLDATGIVAESAEVFQLSDAFKANQWREAFDIAGFLGASYVVVVNLDLPDEGQAAEALAQFSELADEFGLIPTLEPIFSRGFTRTLRDAERLIAASRSQSPRIVIDALHLTRAGTSPAGIRALDRSLIGCAQLCDGLMVVPPEIASDEAASHRLPPGDGEFPLVEFVKALPLDVTIGIEVPMRNLQDAGIAPRDRAELAVRKTRELLEGVAL